MRYLKTTLIATAIGLTLPIAVQTKTMYGSQYVDKVVRVYDGDTFFANFYKFHPIVGKSIGIRINGIDTPEIRGSKCLYEKQLAYKAKDMLIYLFDNGKTIELRNMQRGKYFRIVADVYVDGVSVASILEQENLAVPYYGGTKFHDWCIFGDVEINKTGYSI